MEREKTKRVENARKNLGASQLLAENGYYDVSITRAYYSMFYTAEALLLERGLTFAQHEPVFDHFYKLYAEVIPGFQPYHQYLVEGYRARIVADYRPLIQATASDAYQQIERASAFLDFAQPYLCASAMSTR